MAKSKNTKKFSWKKFFLISLLIVALIGAAIVGGYIFTGSFILLRNSIALVGIVGVGAAISAPIVAGIGKLTEKLETPKNKQKSKARSKNNNLTQEEERKQTQTVAPLPGTREKANDSIFTDSFLNSLDNGQRKKSR